MRVKFINKAFKWTARLLLLIIAIVVLVLIALYIPAVQNFALNKVLTSVNASPSTHVEVKRFRLYPPFHIEVSGVEFSQDSTLTASLDNLDLRVSLWPLLAGRVGINNLSLNDVTFNMNGEDSLMNITSKLNSLQITSSSVALASKKVNIGNLKLSKTFFDLTMLPDSVEKTDTVNTSAPLPWKINIDHFDIDSLTYSMSMKPTIDTLVAVIPKAYIHSTHVDLSSQKVDVARFIVDNLDARYLTPGSDTQAASTAIDDNGNIKEPADTTQASLPWTVKVSHIEINNSGAIYNKSGAMPVPGLDMDYLQLSKVNIAVDSLTSRGTDLDLNIRNISAHERCGIDLMLSGTYGMNSDSLWARNIKINTLYSSLSLDAMMGMAGGALPMPLRVKGSGYLSPEDIHMAMPSMKAMTAGIPANSLLNVNIDINGHDGLYNVDELALELPRCFELGAHGSVAGLPDPKNLDGQLILSGHISGDRWIRPALTAAKMGQTVNVPQLTLNGNIAMHQGTIDGKLKAVTGGRRLALDALWKARSEAYDVTLKADSFPVNAFLPAYEVGPVTAIVDVTGHGYDVMKPSTAIDASVNLADVTYRGRHYRDISLQALLDKGHADVTATSGNRLAAFDLRAGGNLSTTPYDWTFSVDVDHLDLRAMGLSDSAMYGTLSLNGAVIMDPGKPQSIAANINIPSIDWHMASNHIATTDIIAHLLTNDSVTSLKLNNHDLIVDANIPMSLDSLQVRLPRITGCIDTALTRHDLDVIGLQHELPPFTLDVTAGQNNVLNNYLMSRDMGITGMNIAASNDSLIKLTAEVRSFNSGKTVLDTITANIFQVADTLEYVMHLGNRPGTLDQWAQVTAFGGFTGNRGAILLDQRDINGGTGYRLGFVLRWLPYGFKVHVVPKHPVIGYKTWTVNDSNFVVLNTLHKHIDADLSMSNGESSIHLYTEHDQSNDSTQEDLMLTIKDIHINEWMVVNPFAPPMSGDLSAQLRFNWDTKSINGDGNISLTDLYYDRQRVGSFDLGVDLYTDKRGTTRASVALMVDSIKTITAEGFLNDSTARNPFLLDFKMIHFPLNVLNPFLPRDMARMAGTLNGTMDITGSLAEPVFNGYLDFDSTSITIPMLGSTYKFSDEKIPMDSNIVKFDNFSITGVNENPLYINGTVDARHISDILIDLKARARNMQLVGNKKKRGVSVYGKAFIDLDADIKGSLSRLDVDATLSLLESTNVTYIVTSATDNLSSKATGGDMVKFVNFADTAAVASVDTVPPSSMLLGVNAILNIRQGSTIGVDLSTDGKNRVQLQSQGTLNYSMDYMGDSHLTGRLNLNSGFVRYTPPFMSEKLFNFQEGSYVAFSGDMMNPYLNIKAIDVLKANVQQEGQNSRLINFDVILTITNTLQNMDVAFNLATNDDITVANELQSMSPEQRANQAMNMLLYNVYTGPGTKASSSLNGNPLYSFLESQINSWAANNIKGVDLSFGIDQYDRTYNGASSTTTQYSYTVSKSLFNDRFKISVGGNYSDDNDPDQNLSQNLINDISFEYYITPSGSMYIKIFRHTGYESILEGEVTQTGVGFVYKRKLRRLIDMFKPFYRRRSTPATISTTSTHNNTPTQ